MKLFVLVEASLSKSQKMVQACHAVAKHCLQDGTWENKTIVILKANDLESWVADLLGMGYSPIPYNDPYLGPEFTAVSVNNLPEEVFQDLPLLKL